ncbi:MAG: N-acetyltransferase DgcN [Planctomycetota bacterium]|jgi:uncharacterized NAD-dependent epimerase/dehydratase family protein
MTLAKIRSPYLLFLGDTEDQLSAKTATGIATWRPEVCVGEHRLGESGVTVGLKNMSLQEGLAAGAKTLVLGVANRGGVMDESWLRSFREALDLGFDLASGMHQRLADLPGLADQAASLGRELHDVRHMHGELRVGNGEPRSGRRILTVGSDCSSGKMFTALGLEKELHSRGLKAQFRATGQTGILIAGEGISVDAVVADFISGAIEQLAPANAAEHWDLIEGQGSLFHPSYAGVSLGLLHGAQAQYQVLCHEPTREHMRGLPEQAMPDLLDCIEANERAAQVTCPGSKVYGLAVNTSGLTEEGAREYLARTEERCALPCADPMRDGLGRIVDHILAHG